MSSCAVKPHIDFDILKEGKATITESDTINMETYPNLNRMQMIFSMEKQINYDEAGLERDKLIDHACKVLDMGKVAYIEKLARKIKSCTDWTTQKYYEHKLYQKLMSFTDYVQINCPNLKQYDRYISMFFEIDYKALREELIKYKKSADKNGNANG